MKAIALQPEEQERLHELKRYALLDSPAEKEYDSIVQLASQLCQAPIALISFIDAEREWFKAKTGITISEVPAASFPGSKVIEQKGLLQIPDLLEDANSFVLSALTEEITPRFYAGVAISSPEGFVLGVLSVLDTRPSRELSADQVFALEALAGQAEKLIELRLRKSETQRMISTQNRITSIIAHDVRNPLAALKAIIELKTSGMLTEEETTEMLSMSAKQLDGTLEMVANVVDCGKLQIKTKLPEKQAIDIHEQVSMAFNAQQPKATAKGSQLFNSVTPGLTVDLDIETQVLQFILRNLLDNAIKFTENGSVTVRAQNVYGRLELQVSDTGVGIAAAKVPHLFDLQKNNSTPGTRGEKGSGLGLILVRELLEKLRGRIQIESQEQSGTTVTIVL
ncbi:GAF domain-containing sensor histidine kinase [Filimonas effusa]|nr:GAF domain-containing sensor histidine kinase [Filimonas effusa]